MSQWQRVKFEDLLVSKKISYGVVQPGQFQEVGGVPLIRVNNIKNAKVDVSDIVKIHGDVEAKYSKTRLSGGELLITVVGSVGECAIVTEELKGFNVARAVSVANIVDGVDKRFVAYQFRTEDLKFQMYGNTNDTVQPTLNLTELKQLTFTLPPLPEQKAIASVLSSLDDKIDLLHRQNKTLEAMAETLFRQWFIEEAKEDWEEKALDEVVSHFIDYRGKTPNKTTSGIPLITAKIVKAGRIQEPTEFISEEDYPIWMTRGYPEINDVVLTTEAPLGEVGLIRDTNVALAQRIITMRCNPNIFDNVLLKYYLMSEVGQYELDSRASGTTVFGIKASVLKKLSLPIPPLEQQKAVVEQLHAIEDKMYANEQQARSLAKLRDTLLPKLMSGEVRVQYQTEEVA